MSRMHKYDLRPSEGLVCAGRPIARHVPNRRYASRTTVKLPYDSAVSKFLLFRHSDHYQVESCYIVGASFAGISYPRKWSGGFDNDLV